MDSSRRKRGNYMTHEELIYYRERALIERQRAAESTNSHAIEIHEELAALYDRLVAMEATPTLHIVGK